MHISSVMVLARTSRVPRKMPGKPIELLTWFGKSERPVATTAAPAALASQGHISGTGLAQMKTIGSGAIALIQSFSMVSGPCLLRAMHTSAPLRASAMPPVSCSPLVIWQYFHLSTHSALTASMSLRPLCRMPLLSTTCLLYTSDAADDLL